MTDQTRAILTWFNVFLRMVTAGLLIAAIVGGVKWTTYINTTLTELDTTLDLLDSEVQRLRENGDAVIGLESTVNGVRERVKRLEHQADAR